MSLGLGVGFPSFIVAADVNHDGKLDLLTSRGIVLGNGDGTFQAPIVGVPSSAAVGDLNADGNLDLIMNGVYSLGNGDGTFQNEVNISIGGGAIVVGDFNGDGKLDIANPGGASVTTLLQGLFPVLSVSPSTLSFPNQTFDTTSPPQTVTVTNNGSAAVSIAASGIAIAGADPADFSQTNNCAVTLAPGDTCSINVTFTPARNGTYTDTATLTITDGASGSPKTVGLSGNELAPAVSLTTTSLTFSAQQVGTTSAAETVSLYNAGGAALSIAISISGDFAQTNNCGTSVAAQDACQIPVTFTPTANGNRTGTLTIADNAPGSPHLVTLTGTGGLPAPAVSLSPSTITFPSQYTGTSGLQQTLTVTNTGNATLTVTGVTPSAADFGVLSNCSNPVAASASCTIGVFFDPTAGGTRTGTLKITDNAGNSPQTLTLTGSGQDFSMTSGSASATVTAGQTASYTIAVAPAGGFAASVALSCTGGPAGSACAVSPSTIALSGAAAQSAMVTVTTAAHGWLLPFRGGWPRDARYRQIPMILTLAAMFLLMVVASQFLRREQNLAWIRVVGFAALVTLGLTLTSCGGGSGSGGGGTNPQAGTYTVTVTGNFTSGATTLNHSTKLTLVVQ